MDSDQSADAFRTPTAAMDQDHTSMAHALMLPEILREVLRHLHECDLFDAILVNSTWSAIGYQLLWASPAIDAFGSIKLPRAQELANLVRHLHYDNYLQWHEAIPPEEGVYFPILQMITIDNEKESWPVAEIQGLLGPGITHFEYFDQIYHPQDLFKTLRAGCPNLRTLKVQSGLLPGGLSQPNSLDGARQDMQHLIPLLEECSTIVELELDMFNEGRFATEHQLPTEVLPILTMPQLKHVTVRGVLSRHLARDWSDNLSRPLADIQDLSLLLAHPVHVITLLPHLKSIKALRLSFDPLTVGIESMLREIAACVQLKELCLDVRSIAQPVSRDATLTLRSLRNLESLDLWTGPYAPFAPIVSESDIIDLVTELPNLNALHCFIRGLCFSSENLALWGNSLKRLKTFQLGMALRIRDFATFSETSEGTVAVPIFPQLEHFMVDRVMPPYDDMVDMAQPTPTEQEISEFRAKLLSLADIVAPCLLLHTPMLEDFSVYNMLIPPSQNDWVHLTTWGAAFETVIKEAIESRDAETPAGNETTDQ